MDQQELQHDRIREHSSPVVNEKIDRRTAATLSDYTMAPPERIGWRLAELDHEWDVDRAVMAGFSVLGGLSYSLGLREAKRAKGRGGRMGNGWLYLFSAQIGFLLMHALIGWCPPTAVFRRLGVRTSREIEAERRELLKALEHAEGAHR